MHNVHWSLFTEFCSRLRRIAQWPKKLIFPLVTTGAIFTIPSD